MKRFLIIGGVLLAVAALVAFNMMTTKKGDVVVYAEVFEGPFEISVSNSGELLAEKSVDIFGPSIGQRSNQQGGGDHGGQRPGGGMDMRMMELKIQDIVPEGTVVKKGDFIAQLDRSSYSNTLKDAQDLLKTYQNNVDMKILDTAVVLTNLRDDIKNQRYVVEEATITLAQSKYEPPATIRQAEIALDKAQRNLHQKIRGYDLRVAQTASELNYQKIRLSRQERLVQDLEEYLSQFTITAPTDGMVIYKKERNGSKRKAGSQVNPFDRVIATLPDLTAMISKVYVNEIEVSKIKPGQKVDVRVDAFPKKSYTGTVTTIANIGEVLPNSDAKMFEVLIKLDGSDPDLRPTMTTDNKIIIKTFDNVISVPTECVMAGADSLPFVYEKNRTKHIVVLGESNEKNVIIEKGVEPGRSLYVIAPEDAENFKLVGEELIPIIRERNQARKNENARYRKVVNP
ncbi:MAG: efflux RND transporter periplasmic adaptor subunit [Bacteroidales bacterium]|nr:efflux RND transporter periplasmic adaptor subunit [Bacteroidales bacterium]